MSFFESHLFSYGVLPILIFLARICDVSVGTVRIVAVGRGWRFLAPVLGFFEVLIWIIVVGRVMQNLDNPLCYVAYAGGFAAGNYIGILIEQRLAMGLLVIRVITPRQAGSLIEALNQRGFGVTSVEAKGAQGPVDLIYSVVKRSDLGEVVSLIQDFHPKAFYSIEDVRFVQEGIFPLRRPILDQGTVRRRLEKRGK